MPRSQFNSVRGKFGIESGVLLQKYAKFYSKITNKEIKTKRGDSNINTKRGLRPLLPGYRKRAAPLSLPLILYLSGPYLTRALARRPAALTNAFVRYNESMLYIDIINIVLLIEIHYSVYIIIKVNKED